MKMRIISIIAIYIFVSLLLAVSNPLSAKNGDIKHEIRDSLLAVDNLSGSIFYQQNYATVDANWQESNTYIGDYYDMGWMVRFASIGYLSFEVPIVSDEHTLQSARLVMYIAGVKGNSVNLVYPTFDTGNTSVYPEGLLEHIDYGETLTQTMLSLHLYMPHIYYLIMKHSYLHVGLVMM